MERVVASQVEAVDDRQRFTGVVNLSEATARFSVITGVGQMVTS